MPSDDIRLWPAGPVIELTAEERASGRLSEARLGEACQAMNRFGFLQMNDVMPRAHVEALQREYAERYVTGSAVALRNTALEVGHRRFMITVNFEGAFNDPALYGNAYFFPVVDALLGREPVMTSFGSVCAFPRAEAQHVHIDHPPLFSEPHVGPLLPCYALTVVVPLVDGDPAMGTTAAWLGSHRAMRPPPADPDYDEAFLPDARLGSIYMMDYRLLHGGTANHSDRPRPILYLVYGRPWFVDATNFSKQPRIRISASALAEVPEELQGLFVQARGV